jgi:hypothetical protein
MAQATANLTRAISEARRLGYLTTAMEGMLALGELEIRSGAVAQGRLHMRLVKKEATQRGFRVMARKAAGLPTHSGTLRNVLAFPGARASDFPRLVPPRLPLFLAEGILYPPNFGCLGGNRSFSTATADFTQNSGCW